jgi:hypothetical protein
MHSTFADATRVTSTMCRGWGTTALLVSAHFSHFGRLPDLARTTIRSRSTRTHLLAGSGANAAGPHLESALTTVAPA